MHLTLRQLLYFGEIVDTGNMTVAAGRLHVAPTALSIQVKAMEERLGVVLLKRHSRGVQPTAAGLELYKKGKQILSMVHETERLVAHGHSASLPSLWLGVPPSMLRMIGVDTVLAASRQIDGFVVQLVEGLSHDLVARLQSGQLSIVIASELQPSETMRTLELIEERLVFVTCLEDARDGGKVALADALASKLIFYSEQDIAWKVVHAAARSVGLPVNVAQTVGSIDVIRQMVTRGLGTAIVPFGIVGEEHRRRQLAIHDIIGPHILRKISLAWLEKLNETEELAKAKNFVIDLASNLHARTSPYSRLLVKRAA